MSSLLHLPNTGAQQGSNPNISGPYHPKSGSQKKNPSMFIHHSRGPSIERVSLNPVHETDFRAEERDKSEEVSKDSKASDDADSQLAKVVDRVLE